MMNTLWKSIGLISLALLLGAQSTAPTSQPAPPPPIVPGPDAPTLIDTLGQIDALK